LTREIHCGYDGLNMKLSPARHLQRGFTLIELLVVIGILGILAAALVATIDPFEQLNKAQDSNSKNTAIEFLTANIRYYTTHSALPWETTGANCTGGTALSGMALDDALMTTCLQTLVTEGELKSAFTTASGILSGLYATENNANITMCYLPKSKSQQRDVNTKYSNAAAGAGGTACPGGPTNPVDRTCYWCTE